MSKNAIQTTKKIKAIVKKQKKSWYNVITPDYLKSVIVGSIPAYEPKTIIGKNLIINLAHIGIKSFNVNIKLQIIDVNNNVGITRVVGYYISPNYLRRISKKAKTILENSNVFKTKDGEIRIKTVAMSRFSISHLVSAKIRRAIYSTIEKNASQKSIVEITESIIKKQLQKEVSVAIKSLHKLSIVEIKTAELVNTSAREQK